jgi:hypothetical protein
MQQLDYASKPVQIATIRQRFWVKEKQINCGIHEIYQHPFQKPSALHAQNIQLV